MRKMCTYHEYRFSLGLSSLVGMMTGIADASIDDWGIKAFVWAGILFFYSLIIGYEFIVMPTPPRPLLQAFLFILNAPLGLLSAHHWTWYILTIMLGKPIEFKLWLAPNIYADLNIYNTIMIISLSFYILYLVITNFISCEKEYER
jgi:hypothetical protein